jgi:hypothetical protein
VENAPASAGRSIGCLGTDDGQTASTHGLSSSEARARELRPARQILVKEAAIDEVAKALVGDRKFF